jgi:hypothetical protein
MILSGQKRILSAINHEEGDRVPISPPNIVDSYPDEYHIPQVMEYLAEEAEDLDALRYVLGESGADYSLKNALEQGARFIFGSWYFNSLSAGWLPDIFEEVFLPQIREHVELTRSYGAYYDYYDDGKLAQTMEWNAASKHTGIFQSL